LRGGSFLIHYNDKTRVILLIPDDSVGGFIRSFNFLPSGKLYARYRTII